MPGVGKRRIASELGDAATAELAERLLATALEDAADWPGEVVLSPSSDADAEWAAGLLPGSCRVVPQPGDDEDLGVRILAVDRELRLGGADGLVFIGSDAPLLDSDYFEAARTALEHADVVLGPATDGGVTLMASRRPWPPALAALPWSTAGLGAALEKACREAGYSVASLDPRSDVDQAEDLAPLQAALEGDPRPARRRLRDWLAVRPDVLLKVSIVVPVLGDVPELRRLLDSLAGQAGARIETIVVDAGSDPGCRQLCEERRCTYLATRAGRGHQLRLGAERATGQVLWFLHAEAEPPPGSVDRVRESVLRGAAGGCFRFRFDGPRTRTRRVLERLIAFRNRAGGVPYGDQGLFFTREAYEAAGGFADQPLFEEVPLVRGVRRRGSFVALPDPVGVSSRRWERDGWLRRSVENRLLALGYAVGVPPRVLARRYRPIRERGRND